MEGSVFKKTQERILCSAIYYNDQQFHVHQPENITEGFIVTGLRHCNCYGTVAAIVGLNEAVEKRLVRFEPSRKDQGFLTNYNRYVDRKEGMKIAKAANQLIHNPLLYGEDVDLCSEDLW